MPGVNAVPNTNTQIWEPSMDSVSTGTPIVLQCGSTTCKVGLAGDRRPLLCSCTVGVVSRTDRLFGVAPGTYSDSNLTHIRYPFWRGTIRNINDAESVWESSLQRLVGDLTNAQILATGTMINNRQGRSAIMNFLFEKSDIGSLCIAFEPMLSLYASGRTTGLVLKCGGDLTEVFPVVDGVLKHHYCERSNLAGRDVTEYRRILHFEKGYDWARPDEQSVINDVKETMAYVCSDERGETNRIASRSYHLQDGETISLGHEMYRCAEILFRPSIQGRAARSVSDVAIDAIINSSIEHRKDLLRNVQLIGGTVNLRGFADRLTMELEKRTPQSITPRVLYDVDAATIAWTGGSAYANHFRSGIQWISRSEYHEEGDACFARRSNIEFI